MAPIKNLTRQIDDMIDNEIDFWVESKEREAEQMDLDISTEEI